LHTILDQIQWLHKQGCRHSVINKQIHSLENCTGKKTKIVQNLKRKIALKVAEKVRKLWADSG